MKIKKIILFLAVLSFIGCELDNEKSITSVHLKGGESYTFESYYSGKNKSVLWDFGDGHSSTETNPTYAYTTPGDYIVTLSKFKNNKFVEKHFEYKVSVEQLYKPRIFNIDLHCTPNENSYDEYEYFYKNYLAEFYIYNNPDIETDNYSYNVFFNNQLVDTNEYGQYLPVSLNDTGYFDFKFTVYDENNVSDSFDTTIYVGEHETTLNLNVPDFYLSQLGSISERRVLIYDNNSSYNQKDRDYQNAETYGGPSTGNFVMFNSDGNAYINNGDGSSWFWGDSFEGISVSSSIPLQNNVPFSLSVPAHETNDDDDYNNLHLIIVIIGNQGMAYGRTSISVLPGSTTPTFSIDLTFKSF